MKANNEYENKNYLKAIEYLDKIGCEDEFYDFSQIIKSSCLMNLERFDDALKIIDGLLVKEEFSALLWMNKVRCHVFLDESDQAIKALTNLEDIIDKTDKSLLVQVARLNFLVDDYDKALKYCNDALEIDSKFKEALYEKAIVVMAIGDDEQITEVSNRMLELEDEGGLKYFPVFLMNLFSKNYRYCLDLVEGIDSDVLDDEHIEMFKAIIYNEICEENCVNLLVVNGEELPIDDVLGIMLDFVEKGKDSGEIDGVHYFVI